MKIAGRILAVAALLTASTGLSYGGPTAMIYVSAANGNDNWSGLLARPNENRTNGPLATFDKARRTVQTMNRAGLSQITVLFRGGTYYLPTTVDFTKADSGDPNTQIVYQNYPGEAPVFTGGVLVRNWVNVGGNKWRADLPASTQLFENLFYNGERRLRPRLGGYLGQYYFIDKPVILPKDQATLPQNIQNCSVPVNQSQTRFECFDRFYYTAGTPILETWKNLAPAPGNPCGQNAGNSELIGDIELLDFEQFSTSKLRISCIDTANQIIYLTGSTTYSDSNYQQDGFQPGRRYLIENVADAFTEPGQWFLDHSVKNAPVLYYLAKWGENPNFAQVVIPQTAPPLLRTSGLEYVTFRGLTFEHDNYTLLSTGHPSREMEVDVAAAISIQNSDHITFDSGTLRHISGSGLEMISCLPTDPNQSPGPPLNSPPAWCTDVRTNVVNANNSVSNSSFYDIGALGIRIGEPWVPGENDDNDVQFTKVENNVVEGYGRIIPASFGIAQGMGHDNLYTHNEVYDGYHCAISISQQTARDLPGIIGNANNTISFNHVFNLLQGIMSDGGAIRIEAGNSHGTAAGNKIWNNRIHDVTDASSHWDPNGYGGDGIYLDNSTGAVDVKNNLVYRVSDTAVYTPHGPAQLAYNQPNTTQPITVTNNILAFARKAMIGVNSPYNDGEIVPNLVFEVSNNLIYFDRSATSPGDPFYVQGHCTYTAGIPFRSFQAFSNNLYWRTDGKFAYIADAFHQQTTPGPHPDNPCASDPVTDTSYWSFYNFSTQWQQPPLSEDAGSVIKDPLFVFPYFPFDDFALRGRSPLVGFVPFDPNEAGREFRAFEPPPVAPTFVIAPYNPWTDF